MVEFNAEYKELESSIHQELREVFQNIWNHYNVKVKNISIDWLDVSAAGGFDFRVSDLELRTLTKS